jgi:type II secretory pathway component PulJ
MTICFSNKKGISFVELMICIIITALMFGLIYKFMANTRYNYMYGVVNLQNLQEARLAINYIRRDFSSACPRFEDPNEDSQNGYINLQKTRKQLFITQNTNDNFQGDLIQIHPKGLLFNKYIYGSSGEKPKVETITYQFDKSSKTLTRTSETKGMKVFSGIEDVNFALYTHEMNPNVPLLWVQLVIHESENMYGSSEIGKALELTTTISSSFVNSSQNNKYWRYETGHEK